MINCISQRQRQQQRQRLRQRNRPKISNAKLFCTSVWVALCVCVCGAPIPCHSYCPWPSPCACSCLVSCPFASKEQSHFHNDNDANFLTKVRGCHVPLPPPSLPLLLLACPTNWWAAAQAQLQPLLLHFPPSLALMVVAESERGVGRGEPRKMCCVKHICFLLLLICH